MNTVILIGRLTRDPEVRYTSGTQMAVARFTLAIDRPVGQGKEKQADFPSIVAFGKTAELCERFLSKGRQVAVQGRLQTGSYQNKDGATVYTTDVVADRVEFLGSKSDGDRGQGGHSNSPVPTGFEPMNDASIPEGFAAIEDDDLPF